jgi:CheY-like chemotaxis protein
LAPDLELINADPNQMEQVIMNLATNAADAMPDGGQLVIETQNLTLSEEYSRGHLEVRPGRYVLLMVSDTGHGITPQTLEHIFDPFFTTKDVGKGTGLGLSTVYGIVKGHGGHVYCYSEPGLGTTFKVYLSVYQPEAATPPREMNLPKHLLQGKETILLVDDEQALRDLGSHTLAAKGYRVLTASSGEECLDICRAQGSGIDLVLLDLGMPGMGGHKALKAILAINPKAKVVIASGYSANGLVKASLESGAAGFVAKPFRQLDLLATIRSVLDKR